MRPVAVSDAQNGHVNPHATEVDRLLALARAMVGNSPGMTAGLKHDLTAVGTDPTAARDACLHWATLAILQQQPLSPAELDVLEDVLGDADSPHACTWSCSCCSMPPARSRADQE